MLRIISNAVYNLLLRSRTKCAFHALFDLHTLIVIHKEKQQFSLAILYSRTEPYITEEKG